ADPELAALERQLAAVDARLGPSTSALATPGGKQPSSVTEAQKRRDAAATELSAAQAALVEKLQTVTTAHPDAILAKSHVAAAQQALALADSALRVARAGGSPAEAIAAPTDLGPDERTTLERQRSTLRRQVADRRAELSGGAAAPAST